MEVPDKIPVMCGDLKGLLEVKAARIQYSSPDSQVGLSSAQTHVNSFDGITMLVTLVVPRLSARIY
jgi:hypothetical protein